MRQLITGSKVILKQLQHGWQGSPGYWNSRGWVELKDSVSLPYSDFHENNTKGKKNLLSVSNTSTTSCDDMVDMYHAVNMTQSVTIANGFFLYSAAVLEMYFTISKYSKELGLPATYNAIMTSDTDQIIDLFVTNISMEVCARLLYEGSGSLGGYKDKVWLLWGRLTGDCPSSPLLSLEEALECSITYRDSSLEDKELLFVKWFVEAYSGEFLDKETLLVPVAKKVFIYYERYVSYSQYEKGFKDMSSLSYLAEEDMDEFLSEVKSILTGIFRRCSKGLTEASTMDYTDAQQLVLGLTVNLNVGNEELPIFEMAVDSLLSDYKGKLTPFGLWIKEAMLVALSRVALIDELAEESEMDPTAKAFSKFKSV
jgi:hypothetical protein